MIYALTGGGTAGHIYPALAVAEKIKLIDKNAVIYYMGLKGHLEEKLAKKEGYEFIETYSKPLSLKPSLNTIKSLATFFKGVRKSKKDLMRLKVDAVLATGGYVSGPVGYASHLLNIPLYIHESNAHPGVTTRFLDKFSSMTFYSYDEALKSLKGRGEKIYTGTPVRAGFQNITKKDERLVLSFGGSGGQKSINNAVLDIFNESSELPFEWIHIYGLNWEKEFTEGLKNLPKNATIYSYYNNLYELMERASVVVSGPGAITLSEISAAKKASILIPKAYVKENHQYFNAKAFSDRNAAIMIEEKDLNKDSLFDAVKSLLDDEDKRKEMEENVLYFNTPLASKKIAETIIAHLESRQ